VLNAAALAVLHSLECKGQYVIFSEQEDKPRADLNRPWRRITSRSQLSSVRIHDLRHTHASVGAGAGLSLPIIGKLLGHTQSSTTQRYVHLASDPLQKASNEIARALVAQMGDSFIEPAPQSLRKTVINQNHVSSRPSATVSAGQLFLTSLRTDWH